MAYKLTKNRIVQWPVVINMPVDGGEIVEQECTASFEILEQQDYEKASKIGDVALLNRVVVGFGDDIQNEDGSPMACNAANKNTLFNSAPFVRAGFLNAYIDAAQGAASKNSKGLPDIGRTAPKSKRMN
jgi:hypothetical protein